MRWLYLIFGEVGALGSIALSIFLLIQGIGSIVTVLFFIIMPLVIVFTLFVAFYWPKAISRRASIIALITPSLAVLPAIYAITQKVVAPVSPLSAIVVLSWLISTLFAVFFLLRRNAHKNAAIYRLSNSFTLLTATLMLITLSNAFYPIKIIGLIISLVFFILSIFGLIILRQARDIACLSSLLLLLISLSIILAGCILSAFSIGFFYLPFSVLIAISLTLFTVECHSNQF